MYKSSEFGVYLKNKRIEQGLKQEDLSSVINKSVQYISNIEKGKNNAPPDEKDIDKLIYKLQLNEVDAQLFRIKAAADRKKLPTLQMKYILKHKGLIELILYGEKNNLSNDQWNKILDDLKDK